MKMINSLGSTFFFRILFLCAALGIDKISISIFEVNEISTYFLITSSFLLIGIISRLGLESYIVINDLTRKNIFNTYLTISSILSTICAIAFLIFYKSTLDFDFLSCFIYILTVTSLGYAFNLGLILQSEKKYILFLMSQYNLYYIFVFIGLYAFYAIGNNLSVKDFVIISFISAVIIAVFFNYLISGQHSTRFDINGEELSVDLLYLPLISISSALQMRGIIFFAAIYYSGIYLSVIGFSVKLAMAYGIFASVINIIIMPSIKNLIYEKNFKIISSIFFKLILYIVASLLLVKLLLPYLIFLFSNDFLPFTDLIFIMFLAQSIAMLWSFITIIFYALNLVHLVFWGAFTGLFTGLMLIFMKGSSTYEWIFHSLLIGYLTSFVFGLHHIIKLAKRIER